MKKKNFDKAKGQLILKGHFDVFKSTKKPMKKGVFSRPSGNRIVTPIFFFTGVTGGWAGWATAHPNFGRIEGAAGQRRRGVGQHAALQLAHPVFGSHLRPFKF